MSPRTKEAGAILDRDGRDVTALVELAAGLLSNKEATEAIGLISTWHRVGHYDRWMELTEWLDAKWHEDGRPDPLVWFHDTFVQFSDPYSAHLARRARRELPPARAEQVLDVLRLFERIGLSETMDEWIRVVIDHS